MSNVTYLDLDEIKPPQRTIKLQGQEYSVKVFTVDEFIEMNQNIDKVDQDDHEMTAVESVNFLIDEIRKSVPDMPREQLTKLDFDRLMMIVDFLKGVHEQRIQESDSEKK